MKVSDIYTANSHLGAGEVFEKMLEMWYEDRLFRLSPNSARKALAEVVLGGTSRAVATSLQNILWKKETRMLHSILVNTENLKNFEEKMQYLKNQIKKIRFDQRRRERRNSTRRETEKGKCKKSSDRVQTENDREKIKLLKSLRDLVKLNDKHQKIFAHDDLRLRLVSSDNQLLRYKPRETVVVLGPRGAGKNTIISLLFNRKIPRSEETQISTTGLYFTAEYNMKVSGQIFLKKILFINMSIKGIRHH